MELLFGLASVKYATSASSNYTPGSLTTLPDTVKGSVTIEESEGSTTEFKVDQKFSPIKVVKTEEGVLTMKMQFYDMSFANLAALKGGTGNASGYEPATGYTQVEKFIQANLDSGHKITMYNAAVTTKLTGGGGRDKMLAYETSFIPQLTADNAGTWRIDKY